MAHESQLSEALGGAAAEADQTIARHRQAALDVLKPNRRDLEHGLELHRASVVVETYGFSPRAAVDPAALAAVAESGASDEELTDAREEAFMTRPVTDPVEREHYLAAWAAAGVTCVGQNAGEEGNDPLRLMKRLGRFTYVTDHLRDRVAKAVTADDVVAAKRAGRHCLYMTTNGVPLVQRWANVDDELRFVRTFHAFGVRMMHLTYNRRNPIGDGCGEPNDAGLSDFGRHVVAEMNRLGVVVDCAHSGSRTSLDSARVSTRPLVSSHGAAAAVNPHVRAKSDEVIRAIAGTGGLVGICCIPHFLGRTRDVAALLDHIDYIVKRFGADHVGIGTDVAYNAPPRPAGTPAATARPGKRRARWEALWPPGAYGDEVAASMAWTNWPLFTVGLVQRGYADADIQKILGGNMLRVLRANEAQGTER